MSDIKDKILKRSAFRWLLNGEVCRWCYDSFKIDEVCKIHNLQLIQTIDEDTAFVRGELI